MDGTIDGVAYWGGGSKRFSRVHELESGSAASMAAASCGETDPKNESNGGSSYLGGDIKALHWSHNQLLIRESVIIVGEVMQSWDL